MLSIFRPGLHSALKYCAVPLQCSVVMTCHGLPWAHACETSATARYRIWSRYMDNNTAAATREGKVERINRRPFFPLSAVVCPAQWSVHSAHITRLGIQQLTVEKIGFLLILSALLSLVRTRWYTLSNLSRGLGKSRYITSKSII